MIKFNWRKWNRGIHRDLGFLFFAMCVIYGISGVAVNHVNDWNPNYLITRTEFTVDTASIPDEPGKEYIVGLLDEYKMDEVYKKHYFPETGLVKVFLKNGTMFLDMGSGNVIIETLKRRPVLHLFNYYHYNPGKWWTIFSDIFAISLVIISITGLFIIKGNKGITGRGAWLTIAGIVIPLIFMLMFY